MPHGNLISYSDALEQVGSHHKYQYLMLIDFFFQWQVTVFVLMSPLFFLPEPEFICNGNEICDEKNGGCGTQTLRPDEYVTMTGDLELFCD